MSKIGKPPRLLVEDNYLAFVIGSVGSLAWRHLFAKQGNKKIDLLKNGELSCAYYVSTILKVFGQIGSIHATVAGTVRDLEQFGWKKIKKPTSGAVLVWAEKCDQRECHAHIGFCLDNNAAVSNSSKTGKIAKHHLTYGIKNGQPIRAITAIYYKKF